MPDIDINALDTLTVSDFTLIISGSLAADYYETHCMVQAWNDGLTASAVLDNITNVPSQGNFETTPLWIDTIGAKIGFFSDAPDNCFSYANGKEACIWAGYQYRCSGFIIGDADGTTVFDYTSKINNTLSDDNNVAIIKGGNLTIDGYTKLLLHMNGADNSTTFTDSSSSAHTVTSHLGVTITTLESKFGGGSGEFNGTTDYLTVADHSDFDLSGGIWTIDTWIMGVHNVANNTIYFKGTDASNYMTIDLRVGQIVLSIYDSGVEVVNLVSPVLYTGLWHHVEVVENTDDYYIFIDGKLAKSATFTGIKPQGYTGAVYIGASAIGGTVANFYKTYMDELRISKGVARHTLDFTVPSVPYGGSGSTTAIGTLVFIASTRPIQGAYFYVKATNGLASSVSVEYWANGTWNSVSNLSDGTSILGITLAKTGLISFDSTVDLARPTIINNVFFYWYRFSFSDVLNGTKVYYVTLDAPFQKIVDLWDGVYRPIAAFYKRTIPSGLARIKFVDDTINVLNKDFAPGDTYSYTNIGLLLTTQYIICGFYERMTGITFDMVSVQYGNTDVNRTNTQAANANVQYWDGDSWVDVVGLVDGTKEGTDTLSKSGAMTWDAVDEFSESRSKQSNDILYWYYKISFSHALSANVFIDQIQGIPAQKLIHGYRFPVMWQNALWLLNEECNKTNGAIRSASQTVCVWNGGNSIEQESPIQFGNSDPITGGASFYTRFGDIIHQNLVVFKQGEVWIVEGTEPKDYKIFKISDSYGCVAPSTLISCSTGFEISPGIFRHILIWQASNAICMFDGNAVTSISDDTKNFFDPTKPECINSAMIDKSQAFFDEQNLEYHWLFASGNSPVINKELVYAI